MRFQVMHSLFFVPFLLTGSPGLSCGPALGNKVGAFCSEDEDCQSGLCYASVCLDPDGDEDGDGLKNGLEGVLGTNPLSVDSDGDTVIDPEEVQDVSQPADGDGDGRIDALESSLPSADGDGDCLPDQFDPDNLVFEEDLDVLLVLFCLHDGVCQHHSELVKASCVDSAVSCDYTGIANWEPAENTCDGLDNDCDGETDEGLSPKAQTKDFAGTWYGTCPYEIDGETGTAVVTLTLSVQDDGLKGTYQEGTESPLDISGKVTDGSFTFAVPNSDPDHPDCSDWDATASTSLESCFSTMRFEMEGTYCSSKTGKLACILARQ